jgi:hypothetical protein
MLLYSGFGRENILARRTAGNPWIGNISNYMRHVATYRTTVSSVMMLNYVVYVAAELQPLPLTARTMYLLPNCCNDCE